VCLCRYNVLERGVAGFFDNASGFAITHGLTRPTTDVSDMDWQAWTLAFVVASVRFAWFGCWLPVGCALVLAGLVPCFVLELSFVTQQSFDRHSSSAELGMRAELHPIHHHCKRFTHVVVSLLYRSTVVDP
jgi:hypothetical protein